MRGLHRLTGSVFLRAKPGLCARCAHRTDYHEWEGYCLARRKILSAPKSSTRSGRCDDFAPRNDENTTRDEPET